MAPKKTINVKELDLNMLQPNKESYIREKQGGQKTVIIGKAGCFEEGTKILMYDGSVKNVENVQVGDLVMGDDSTSRTVLELCKGIEEMYVVQDKNGGKYVVNKSHKLLLKNKIEKNKIVEITIGEYIKMNAKWKNNWFIFKSRVEFQTKSLEGFEDPYAAGYNYYYDAISPTNPKKKIADIYKFNSFEVRNKFLAGVLDFYGEYNKTNYCFECTFENMMQLEEIRFLAGSLGFVTTLNVLEVAKIERYRISIYGKLNYIPVKKILLNVPYFRGQKLISAFKVYFKHVSKYYGFTLDGNNRFLLDSFDVVRNTGKSTLISELLRHKMDIYPTAMIMSGTEDSTGFYSRFFPDTFIYEKLEEKQIEKFIARQKLAIQNKLSNPWGLLLLDDCTDTPSVLKKPLFQGIFKNGRNWKMWFILSLQYCLDVSPSIRSNIDGVFILRETSVVNRKKIYENYASVIPTYKLFCELMDVLTNDYSALYINNQTTSNNWEDCVFWYKANLTDKPFRFGCEDYWKFHLERYNDNYQKKITI